MEHRASYPPEKSYVQALVECGYVVLSAPSNTVTRPEFKTALDKIPQTGLSSSVHSTNIHEPKKLIEDE